MRRIKHIAVVIGTGVLAASACIGAPALATGGSGISVSNFVTGHYGPINENSAQNKTGKWGMILKTLDDTDIGVDDLVIQPGGYAGWHTHPSAVFVTVIEGSIVWTDGSDPLCTPHNYTAGQSFIEAAYRVHNVQNTSGAVAKFKAVHINPTGVPFRIDEVKPKARSHLDAEERQAILALPFVPAQVRANHDFVRQGQRLTHSCFVLDGVVGSFKQDSDGNRQIVSVFINGDMVDLHSVMMPEAPAALQALTSSTILQVPHSALRQLARDRPNIGEAFWRHCVVDAGILMEWVINVGRRDARKRMAHFFCELATRSVGGEPEDGMVIPYPITQFQLSDILSLTAVHVNRMMQALRQARLLESVERSNHRILDWNGLAFAGDFDPGYLQLAEGPIARSLSGAR